MPNEKREIVVSPELQEYISELRQEVKKARKERDELKHQLEAKPSPIDVRDLSKQDYRKAKAEAMRNIIKQERERGDATILTNLTGVDVRKMTPEEYHTLQKKLARRG